MSTKRNPQCRDWRKVDILLSDIISTSTCEELKAPYDYSCNTCKVIIDAKIGIAKKRRNSETIWIVALVNAYIN